MSNDWDGIKDRLGLPRHASQVQTFRAALSFARVAAAEARGEHVKTAEIVRLADRREPDGPKKDI